MPASRLDNRITMTHNKQRLVRILTRSQNDVLEDQESEQRGERDHKLRLLDELLKIRKVHTDATCLAKCLTDLDKI